MTINSVSDLNSAVSGELRAFFSALLDQFGLGSLGNFAAKAAQDNLSEAEFVRGLEAEPAFKNRFPAIFTRREQGLPPVTPVQILSFERQVAELENLYGLPKGFLGTQVQTFIADDTSFNQLQQQVAFTKNQLENGDPQVLQELDRLFGLNVSSGGLLAFGLNPDRALPILTEQAAVATIAAAANQGGDFVLTLAEAQRLENQGLDPNVVRQTAGALSASGDLISGIGAFSGIDRETQLGVLAGDQKAIGRVRKRQEELVAPFRGGGAFATDQRGVAGIGVAQ